MGLIDSHAHLTHEALAGDTIGVLERAAAAGVEHVISIASDVADSERAIALAQRYPQVSATAGIHPHEAGKVQEGGWQKLADLIQMPEVAACGELGLDYHYDFADPGVQRDVLARQLKLARTVDKPLVVHCREAFDDTIALLREAGFEGRRVVFHCFSGSKVEAARVADHGWRLSFTGLVTFKNAAEVREVAREYPADQLMLETDSPYLSPVPKRSTFPNEPAHVRDTAEFLAQLRCVEFERLVEQTSQNARSFFKLP
jgi:TatD DNase family protein